MTDFPSELRTRYQPLGEPRRGGMAQVYPCLDTFTNCLAGVKVFTGDFLRHPASGIDIQRFNQEAMILGGLRHPNIVRLLEHGFLNGQTPFYSMEWVEGLTLCEVLEGCRRESLESLLTPALFFSVATRLLAALHEVHRNGFLHRDVKPHNVMLTAEGGLKLIDFGLGKDLAKANGLTGAARFLGTPEYFSPEHLKPPVRDPRSDLFCTGWVLWCLSTGNKSPLADLEINEILSTLAQEHLFRNSLLSSIERYSFRLMGSQADTCRGVLQRLLTWSPRERFQTALEVSLELETAFPADLQEDLARPVSNLLTTLHLLRKTGTVQLQTEPDLPAVVGVARALLEEVEWLQFPEAVGYIGNFYGEVDECPPAAIGLTPFCISRYAVTASQFVAFIRDAAPPEKLLPVNEFSVLVLEDGRVICPAGCENLPVNCVSYAAALAYCRWLSERLGILVTLPTEAHWEAAASWDLDKGQKIPYPWGIAPEVSRAHLQRYWIDPWHTLAQVDAYSRGASPCGCVQMIGNVWEWCRDAYRPDAYDIFVISARSRRWLPNLFRRPGDGARVLPESHRAAVRRVARGVAWEPCVEGDHGSGRHSLRGGDFGTRIEQIRNSLRSHAPGDARLKFVGFRLASPGKIGT
jgi:formylglycine-generating enzyme required for sulfatase activity